MGKARYFLKRRVVLYINYFSLCLPEHHAETAEIAFYVCLCLRVRAMYMALQSVHDIRHQAKNPTAAAWVTAKGWAQSPLGPVGQKDLKLLQL